jgi:hypothetical protein
MAVVRLPVADRAVVVRFPCGAEDLLLLEAKQLDLRVAVALLERIVRGVDGAVIDIVTLPLGDIDALLLELRRLIVSDLVRADTACAAPGCRARVDVAFSIADYLAHHAPDAAAIAGKGLAPADEPGWYRLAGGAALRVPRAEDQLAIAWDTDPERALFARCVRPSDAADAPELRAQIEDALEALAPDLCGELTGTCPECGAPFAVDFDPLQYTLRELRRRAETLYEDVAWIAHHYHWSEAEILALPAERRSRYAELAADHARQRRTG